MELSNVPLEELVAEIERRIYSKHAPRVLTKIQLGRALTVLREKLGWSGKQAAMYCGVSQSFFSMAENGERHSAKLIRMLEQCLAHRQGR